MLTGFRWYRRLRGGRWLRTRGRLWGRRWRRPAVHERAEEDYTALGSVENFRRFRG